MKTLFGAQLKLFFRLLKEPATAIVAVIFFFVLSLVMVGEFFGFREGFEFLFTQEYFGRAVSLYILEAFLLLAFILTVVSSVITASGIFFHAPDLRFAFTLPIRAATLFKWRLLLFFLVSSWPITVIAAPGIIALGSARDAGISFYFITLSGLIFFLFTACSTAALITLFIARLARIRTSSFVVVGLMLFAVLGGWGLSQVIVPRDIFKSFDAVDLSKTEAPIERIETAFLPFPSHPVAKLAFNAAENEPGIPLLLGLVGLTAAGLFTIVLIFGKEWFAKLFLKAQEGDFIARSEDVNRKYTKRIPFPLFLRGVGGAIIEKDIRSILRNRRDVASLSFFLLLGSLYIFLLSGAAQQASDGYKDRAPLLLALNFGGIGYFLATVSLRFLFPLIGREGQSAWILSSMPVRPAALILSKITFGAPALTAIAAISAVATLPFFEVTHSGQLHFFIFSTLSALFLSLFQTAMGGVSPELRRRDPERMSTTPQGLVTTFISLVYIATGSFIVYATASGKNVFPYDMFYIIFSLILPLLILRIAARKLTYIES